MGQWYRHLTEEDRIVIRTLLQEKRSRRYTAGRLGRDVRTVKREIRRNSGLRRIVGGRVKDAFAASAASTSEIGSQW